MAQLNVHLNNNPSGRSFLRSGELTNDELGESLLAATRAIANKGVVTLGDQPTMYGIPASSVLYLEAEFDDDGTL